MDKILVSIDCITYNQEKYVKDTIESFLMQKTNFKFEILIHDDASKDKTADIIKEYQKKYPDIIKPVLEEENQYSQGVKRISYKYNLTRAKGKYIAFCEGDDYWTDPYKLQKQVDYMESHPECSMCFHAAEIIRAGKGKVGVIKPYNKNCISPMKDIISGGGEFMATNSILYRKEIVDNPPEFYMNAPVGDYPLQILSSAYNYAYYFDEYMSVYRESVKGSWSKSMAADKEAKNIKLCNDMIDMLKEINKYFDEKYSDVINKKIQQYEFQILLLKKNIKQLKAPEYKDMYDSLGIKKKIKIHANRYFPKTYKKLVNVKSCIEEKLQH